MVYNSCYQCKKRKVGCHAKCKEYLEFREWLDKLNEEHHKQKQGTGKDYYFYQDSRGRYRKRRT